MTITDMSITIIMTMVISTENKPATILPGNASYTGEMIVK